MRRRYVCASIAGAAIGAIAYLAGLPDLVALITALVTAVALGRPPPASRAPSRVESAAPNEPGFDLGLVISAPLQTAPLYPGRRFWLALAETTRHVAVVGATGSGKTTTLGRFMDAALNADWAVVVVDAKGGRLADFSRQLGARHSLATRVWLPGAADTWTYDVCSGDPISVGNRLVGAFEHGREGQVYRNLAQGTLPLVVRALRETDGACDLDRLRFALERAHLVGLARRTQDPFLKSELLALRDDELHRQALSGLVGRLRALRFGLFGPWLLPSERTLDLGESLRDPGLTYLGLPATAASEDVALVGRVLVQHLKQLAYTALWATPRRPGLLVFDEFLSLHEAQQLIDLLLQAREAQLAIVVSTQQLPRVHPLHHGVLSAGTLVVHQVGTPSEARDLAETLGTRAVPEVVRHVALTPRGTVSRRLLRGSSSYLIPPDELTALPVGRAAVSVRFGDQRVGLVQVDPHGHS